ncbi:PLP-dependent transferase [Nadsonia fulvescens var. elongata DSM 6958]|uniref:PLP-dependent transferase n=1 Tax=Nadsonia fulvescens var. elongata DSM 6958 TaxID=857566 RepID=A0A1E3PM03_9ASCO|nr:PLP-dependent transferase [Nadsonia fulvescens var. elongata DSM 6958]
MSFEFGNKFRKFFQFPEGVINLNNGSFGSTPQCVAELRQKLLLEEDTSADGFKRYDIHSKLEFLRQKVSKLIDADDSNNIAFTYTTMSAINSVLLSYQFKKGDVILYFSCIYGPSLNTLLFLRDRYDVELVCIDVDYPNSSADFVSKFEKTIASQAAAGKPVLMGIIDSITSMPGYVTPFEALVKVCKDNDVISFVDGAHMTGLVQYSIKSFKPDFFCGNFHKWLYGPRPCAFLYAARKFHTKIQSIPIGSGYFPYGVGEDDERLLVKKLEALSSQFSASILALEASFDFVENTCGGIERVNEYNIDLAQRGGKEIAKIWGTEMVDDAYKTAMVNVCAPVTIKTDNPGALATQISKIVYEKHKIFIPIVYVGGQYYARISAQVYSELEDFVKGANAFLDVIESF